MGPALTQRRGGRDPGAEKKDGTGRPEKTVGGDPKPFCYRKWELGAPSHGGVAQAARRAPRAESGGPPVLATAPVTAIHSHA